MNRFKDVEQVACLADQLAATYETYREQTSNKQIRCAHFEYQSSDKGQQKQAKGFKQQSSNYY